MTKYTIYDLLNPEADRKLNALFKRFHIHFDPHILVEKNQPSQDLLYKIYSLLHINAKAIEAKLIHIQAPKSHTLINKQSEREFLNKLRVYCIVKSLYIQSLTLDALKVYAKNKKIKQFLARLRAFISRISAANHARLIAEYEAEKKVLDQRLKEIINALKYENLHVEAEKQMIEYLEKMRFYQSEIISLTSQRDRLLEEHSENFYYIMSTYQAPNGESLFDNVSPEQIQAFARDFETQDYRLEKKIRNNQDRENNCLLLIENIDLAIQEKKVASSLPKPLKNPKGVYATSLTTLLSLKKNVDNDPEIIALQNKKNALNIKIQTLQAERKNLVIRQNDLPLILAKEHQLTKMVNLLSPQHSEYHPHFINTFHHQRTEKRNVLQDQRIRRRDYRRGIEQIQKKAQQLHEIDQQSKNGQKKPAPSTAHSSASTVSFDKVYSDINTLVQSMKVPPRMKPQ